MAGSTVASLSVEITGDISGLNRAIGTADQKVTGFGSRLSSKLSSIGDSFSGIGRGLATVTAPLAAFGIAGLAVASTFESSMNEISARTGLVGEDLERVRQYALQMGADTSFSAQQASDAFLQLLSSGSSVEEAIALLPGVLDLAAASAMDLGTTADAVTDIMAQFGLTSAVDEAPQVLDALVQAAGASSATVEDLVAGFANVGPVAAMFGLNVEETAATLAVLAENGIKSAEGGTALKSVLLNLTRPTDKVRGALNKLGVSIYDSEGNVRDFNDILYDLDGSLDELPMNEQIELSNTLAGSYGITAFNALRASGGIDEMLDSMEGAAGASDVADARMKGFAGSLEALKGSVETLMINALTPLMENVLTPLFQSLTPVVNKISDWVAENPELVTQIGQIALVAIGLTGALIIGGPIISAWGGLISGIGTIARVAFTPIGALVGLIAAFADWGKIGDGAVQIANGIDMMIKGDAKGGLKVVGDGVWHVAEGLAAIPGNAYDALVLPLAAAAGIELPTFDEVITMWTVTIPDAARQLGDRIGTDLAMRIQIARDDITGFLGGIGAAFGKIFADIGKVIQGAIDLIARFAEAVGSVLLIKSGLDTGSIADAVIANANGGGGDGGSGGGNWWDNAVPGHRTGLSFVPNDNYAAMLHRGERVLTANENRAYTSGRGGGGATVNIYGGVFPNGPQEFAEYVKDVLNGSAYG